MARDFADLYTNNTGKTSWYLRISDEAKQWLHELAEFIDDRGKEPTWAAVGRRFAELFPDDAPEADGTISSTVRKLRG